MENPHYFIGIGCGVFNLSLAALIDNRDIGRHVFLDRKPAFSWHDNPSLAMADMQTSVIKDIVTPADPTNRFSFLNFLFELGLLEHFLNRNSYVVSRRQFNAYLTWVSERLDAVRFGVEVLDVGYDDGAFVVDTSQGEYRSRHLVVGSGLTPFVPPQFDIDDLPDVYHSSKYSEKSHDFNGKRVAIIGGGTSGIEIYYDIIAKFEPECAILMTERTRLVPLEDSSFTNEYFTSSFVSSFYDLPADKRSRINADLVYAGDGITPSLSDGLFKLLYEKKFFTKSESDYRIQCNTSLMKITESGSGLRLTVRCMMTDRVQECEVDAVILATGYTTAAYSLLKRLESDFPELAERDLDRDYSLRWRHSGRNNIFLQNAARHTHGVPDPYLSLAAWRASVIANALAGRELFRTRHRPTLVTFPCVE